MGKSDYFYVKRPGGVVTGPFPFVKIEAMLRQGRLSGEDCLSTDREHWFGALDENALAGTSLQAPDAPPRLEVSPAPLKGNGPPAPTPLKDTSEPTTLAQPPQPADAAEPQKAGAPPELDFDLAEETGPSGSELAAMVLSSVWQGPMFFRRLESRVDVLRAFALLYSLAVCICCWVLFPPAVVLCGSAIRSGVAIGVGAWLFLVLSAWFGTALCCWLSWRHFRWEAPSQAAVWLALARNATLCGAMVLWRHALRDARWLPVSLAVALFVWNEACRWRIMKDYVARALGGAGRAWMLGAAVASLIDLEIMIFSVYYFGGCR